MGATWCAGCKSQTKAFEAAPPPIEVQEIDIDKEFNVKVLDIPDAYPHMDRRLVEAFITQYEPI